MCQCIYVPMHIIYITDLTVLSGINTILLMNYAIVNSNTVTIMMSPPSVVSTFDYIY